MRADIYSTRDVGPTTARRRVASSRRLAVSHSACIPPHARHGRHSGIDRASTNFLTKLVYLNIGHLGARVLACGPAFSVGVGQMDPEELVTLTDHGVMKLRSAVVRAMILRPKERKRATIVREGEPAILKFEQIKSLAAQWDERLTPVE